MDPKLYGDEHGMTANEAIFQASAEGRHPGFKEGEREQEDFEDEGAPDDDSE